MSAPSKIHYTTVYKWVNSQPPYIQAETIRSALRRLEKKGFVIKSSNSGHWKFNKLQKNNAIKFLQIGMKSVTLDGVSTTPLKINVAGLSGDWLNFAKVRFEANEPFRFRVDNHTTKTLRSACDPERKGKKLDRSHKRSWQGITTKLAITHKGSVVIWANELNFIPELNDFIIKAGLSEEGTRRFFRKMFDGSPVTGTLEYPVIADKDQAKHLKSIVIETFQGDDKVTTRFCSSHDAIEMEQKGNITNLQNFLGMISGIQHSTFYDAIQVEKLTKIEKILQKSQTDLSASLKIISESMIINAKALDKISTPDKPMKLKKLPNKKGGPGIS